MKSYREMSREELCAEKSALEECYQAVCAKGLKLDMSRGKPAKEQLDLAMPMLDVISSKYDLRGRPGADLRNYGIADGIAEAKELIASMIDTSAENVIVCGNASLQIMYDTVSRSFTHGVMGNTPWGKLGRSVKFLCPVPGYDRHFAITESFGIEMINIPLHEDGPDMDLVEELVSSDPYVKGIWCVPKYSNPLGVTYSEDTVRRFAKLRPAASDFRIYWDNAYCVHHLYEDRQDTLPDILAECQAAGHPDMVYEFCSTSKITFAGSGISGVAASAANRSDILKQLSIQIIGFDKINQLRHVLFLKDKEGLSAHMMRHASIMRPKFEMLRDLFTRELSGLGVGSWSDPRGGYFITYMANPGCAKAIIGKAMDAGVVMTGAGAPYPYKNDPDDSVIRIAPTMPSMDELRAAADVFVTCVKLVSIEQLLS